MTCPVVGVDTILCGNASIGSSCDQTDECKLVLENASDFSDAETIILEEIDDMFDDHVNPAVNDILKQAVNEYSDTHMENETKLFQSLVSYKPNTFQLWYENQIAKMQEISLAEFPHVESKFTSKHLSNFYKKYNMYLNS
jgi:superfamily II DNA/RNA helicase